MPLISMISFNSVKYPCCVMRLIQSPSCNKHAAKCAPALCPAMHTYLCTLRICIINNSFSIKIFVYMSRKLRYKTYLEPESAAYFNICATADFISATISPILTEKY